MKQRITRRRFLTSAVSGAAAVGFSLSGSSPGSHGEVSPVPKAGPHKFVRVSGRPRRRGEAYGKVFRDEIHRFLEQEILNVFVGNENSKEDLLAYASLCLDEVRRFSSDLAEEMAGIADGAGLETEETALISLHEELYHRGRVPTVSHCTAAAAGPPDTEDGHTYIAQSWDWMKRLYGVSGVVLWECSDGPDVLSYHYPGLWVSAGLNSEGVGLVWTSAALDEKGPRVGIPTYALIAQVLHQPTLEKAVEEARRAEQAGWFAFVVADAEGRLARVEGSPKKFAVEYDQGHFGRVYYGTREMTGTPDGKPVPQHPQCERMNELLDSAAGRIRGKTLQRFYGDHESTICKHLTPERSGGSLDVMVLDLTKKRLTITRGPACRPEWKTFGFDT